ncbi:hypothetical protein FCM35_KLT07841 [Carex littledalei]|uniref:Uncharacterized protein n=1 Tax=Carex littledalei TaxID=544730 RepID=A0A833QS43_9POAL|nr:hypothetical protein FCM35_KLT07841 [Carex littledalei]
MSQDEDAIEKRVSIDEKVINDSNGVKEGEKSPEIKNLQDKKIKERKVTIIQPALNQIGPNRPVYPTRKSLPASISFSVLIFISFQNHLFLIIILPFLGTEHLTSSSS